MSIRPYTGAAAVAASLHPCVSLQAQAAEEPAPALEILAGSATLTGPTNVAEPSRNQRHDRAPSGKACSPIPEARGADAARRADFTRRPGAACREAGGRAAILAPADRYFACGHGAPRRSRSG